MSELIDCINNLSAKDIIRAIAKTANGLPFYLQTSWLSGFCAEYQAVYDALTTKPSNTIAEQQNIMVCGLVDDGVWAKLDIFYNYAQTTNGGGEALVNWVNPGTFDATAFNAPVFTALEGFLGDGATTYIDCNWNINTNGVNFVQNDASFGIYLRTDFNEGALDCGAQGSGGADGSTLATQFGNIAYLRVNCTTQSSVGGQTDSKGMYIANRTLSTHQDLYRNKIRIINAAQNSTGVISRNMFVLAVNNNSAAASHNTKQTSLFFAGSGFTQTDIDNMTDRFETYMDSNGKGVIP